jgi:hypothetical protein
VKVPAKFETDLTRAYEGNISIKEFIEIHEDLLRGLARHALRYKTQWYLSDEDDMYQEACYWLIRAMWDYDERRGRTLCDYVLYNIGARLNTQIRVERAVRRHPDPNTSRKVDIWEKCAHSNADHGINVTVESTLPSPCCDPETRLAIKRAFDTADEKLTTLARELLVVLIEENGNLAASARRLVRRKHIRKRFGSDPKHLEYMLNKRVLQEIFQHFQITAIIPVNGMPSNG